MHTVDRGPPPASLRAIRGKYTTGWVNYYSHDRGRKPSDAHWLRFRPLLSHRFARLCGYCEELCAGEVDHFRPKARNPQLTYCWENWIFSCHNCNASKGSKWPTCGYISPCPDEEADQPERFFTFDTVTCEIIARDSLAENEFDRAQATIDDLGLNSVIQLKKRLWWLGFVKEIAGNNGNAMSREAWKKYTSRRTPFSSVVRAWLHEESTGRAC